MRKPFAVAVSIALLLCLAACGRTTGEAWILPLAGVTGAWFTEEQPTGETDPGVLRVGRTYDGKDIFALLRVALPEDISSPAEAWLSLKTLENNGSPALLVGALTGPWEENISCGEAKALVGDLQPARQMHTQDGRVRIDVTEHFRAWFAGEENYGIILFEANGSTETAFFAGEGEDAPRLELKYG